LELVLNDRRLLKSARIAEQSVIEQPVLQQEFPSFHRGWQAGT
jgi:hypothetical protein